MQGYFDITINGSIHRVAREPASRPFLAWLRDDLGLTGTKEGNCTKGHCTGNCAVCILDWDGRGRATYRAVAGCGMTLPMVAGQSVITVEALGHGESAHPVRRAFDRVAESTCGYCSPGLLMSLFEIYYRDDVATLDDIHDALGGHACRCGGARVARDAAILLVEEARALRLNPRRAGVIERVRGPRKDTARIEGDAFDAALASATPDGGSLSYIDGGGARFHRPRSLLELLRLRKEHGASRLVGAGTSVAKAAGRSGPGSPCVVSSGDVVEMRTIFEFGSHWEIGASVTLSSVKEAVRAQCGPLERILEGFGSRLSRNRATLGGALCAPESVGEIGPVLIVLGATAVIVGLESEREMALEEFLAAGPEESLRGEEVLKAVRVPRPERSLCLMDVLRVAARHRHAPSFVNLAASVRLDAERVVVFARVATGAAWARPVRAIACEETLIGQVWNGATVKRAAQALRSAAPEIGYELVTGEYRRAVTGALLQKFFYGNPGAGDRRVGESAPGSVLARPIAEAAMAEPGDYPARSTASSVIEDTAPFLETNLDPDPGPAAGKAALAPEGGLESAEATGPVEGERDLGASVPPELAEGEADEVAGNEDAFSENIFVDEPDAELDTAAGQEPEVVEIEIETGEAGSDEDGIFEDIFADAPENEARVDSEAMPSEDTEPAAPSDANPIVEKAMDPVDAAPDGEDESLKGIFVEESETGLESQGDDAGRTTILADTEEPPGDADAPEFGNIFIDPDAEESTEPEVEGEEVVFEDVFAEQEGSVGVGVGDSRDPEEKTGVKVAAAPAEALQSIAVPEAAGSGMTGDEAEEDPDSATEGPDVDATESPTKGGDEIEEAAPVPDGGNSTGSPKVAPPRSKLPPRRKVSLDVKPRNGVVVDEEESPS